MVKQLITAFLQGLLNKEIRQPVIKAAIKDETPVRAPIKVDRKFIGLY